VRLQGKDSERVLLRGNGVVVTSGKVSVGLLDAAVVTVHPSGRHPTQGCWAGLPRARFNWRGEAGKLTRGRPNKTVARQSVLPGDGLLQLRLSAPPEDREPRTSATDHRRRMRGQHNRQGRCRSHSRRPDCVTTHLPIAGCDDAGSPRRSPSVVIVSSSAVVIRTTLQSARSCGSYRSGKPGSLHPSQRSHGSIRRPSFHRYNPTIQSDRTIPRDHFAGNERRFRSRVLLSRILGIDGG
jgi:hypothetical protein